MSACLMTTLVYFWSGVGLLNFHPLAIAILNARNLTLVAIFVLILGALVTRRRRHPLIALPGPLLRAFGVPAVVCVAAVVVTGTALTGRQVASVDALLTTSAPANARTTSERAPRRREAC